MFPPRTALRSVIACTLACGLLATSSAAARQIDDAHGGATTSSPTVTTCPPHIPDGASTSCLPAGAAPRQDLRSPDARDAARAELIARQMEQYYEQLGGVEPVAQPAVAAPADDSPWLPISVIAGALALVLASAALVLRRRRVAV
jgi:hypothetical protein